MACSTHVYTHHSYQAVLSVLFLQHCSVNTKSGIPTLALAPLECQVLLHQVCQVVHVWCPAAKVAHLLQAAYNKSGIPAACLLAVQINIVGALCRRPDLP